MAVPADPFGLWELPPEPPEGAPVSFGLPDEAVPIEQMPAAIWRVALSAGTADPLAERAAHVAAIQQGLAQAGARMQALVAARRAALAGAAVSFSLEAAQPGGSQAEQELSLLLDALEPAAPAVSFGLFDPLVDGAEAVLDKAKEIAALSEAAGQLERVLQNFNRQVLNYAWVETLAENRLAARTVVNWLGDSTTYWQPGASAAQQAAHRRSLELALESRAASLKMVLTAASLAGTLALAVTTPLGPLQALVLAWKFVNDVIQPALKALQMETVTPSIS